MRRFLPCIALTLLLIASPAVRAGLYYRGEQVAELPSQWSGFLLDQRLLRSIGIRPRPGGPVNPARDRYGREAERLAALVQHALPGKAPTADDLADLGVPAQDRIDLPALCVLCKVEGELIQIRRLAADRGAG